MKIFFALLVLVCLGCNNQNDDKLQNEIYSLINHIIEEELNKENNGYISEELIRSVPPQTLDLLIQDNLSEKDSIFINIQIINHANFKLDQNKIPQKKVLLRSDLDKLIKSGERSISFWKRFKEKYNKKNFETISQPIFNKSMNLAIISYGIHCGSLCGSGETAIYEKKSGKWVKIKTIMTWVS